MRNLLVLLLISAAVSTSWAHGSQYRLGPGDKIEVWVGQDPTLNRQLVVRPDGRISMPLAGHLNASGLTPEQFESALRKRLQKNFSTDLDLVVMFLSREEEDEPDLVYMTGEVNRPGALELTQRTTVLQAIARAGGLGQFAAKRRLQIRRRIGGEEVLIPFNYRDVEVGRDLVDNIYLRAGDVVVVPERGLFE